MAPIKFEENIQEKLEQRTMQPSSDAWNTLANKLDAEDKKKPNKTYWWLGIAASVIGVLLVTNTFYNNEIVKTTQPTIVTIDNNKAEQTETKKISNEVQVVQNNVVLEEENIYSKQQLQVVSQSHINKSKINIITPVEPLQERIAQNKTNPVLHKDSIKKKEPSDILFEAQNATDVMVQNNETNQNNQEVSVNEIEALLKQAQQDIALQSINTKNIKTINANDLLQDVETDLDQSFRDKAFETLKINYVKVKTAVVQRNN